MKDFEQKRNKQVFKVTAILKTIYILLSLASILSSFYFKNKIKNYLLMYLIFGILFILIFIYFLILSKNISKRVNASPKIVDYLEMLIMLYVFLIVVTTTGGHNSRYKILSVFIVLIGAIQFSRNYSLGMATISAIIILSIDLLEIGTNKESLIEYFEKDLILFSVLFITAFILGMYVDIERDHCKELKTLANIDELTGLYNYRYFQEFLQKSIDYANKEKQEVSLLFMDIDYFKTFNDVNGHQAGDLILKEIGEIMKACIRSSDVVARYGGEEFAVILPNTTEDEAMKIGERIRLSIQNTYFKGQENQPNNNVTISIGVSSYPNRSSSKHQLISTADDALYRAKVFNRNRVEL